MRDQVLRASRVTGAEAIEVGLLAASAFDTVLSAPFLGFLAIFIHVLETLLMWNAEGEELVLPR
jgi:hypothetical protein